MIEDINERMTQFAPSQNNPLNDDPIAEEIAIARQVMPQPDAATIEVDPIAEEIAQSRRDLMMATFGSAADANPDQAAQAKKLGEQFGVGADIAGRNMQQLKKQALLDELERRDLMRRDPILARYLSNHDFAAMAHDDIDNLAKTEDLFQGSWFARYEDPIAYGKKTISMIDERFRRGRAIVEMGRANDLLGLRAQWSPDPRKASEISEELKKLTTEGGIVGAGVEVVGQMLEGIPEVAETTAMGATTGGAVGAVGGPAGFVTIPAGMLTGAGAGFAAGSARSAFMAESGNSYQQMIEQGYDPEVARKAAIGVGVVNASIEMISFGALGPVLRKLGVNVFRPAVANALAKPTAAKALATLGSDYAKAVAAGASEEFLQEIATGIGDDIARVYGSSSPSRILDDGGITDLLGTALESGVQGAMGMAIMGGIGPVANFRYDMRRAGAAERQQAFFERLSANAVDSKLRGRDMNAFERFVASQAEGTEAETIFVDAAAMQGVLRQSNLSDEQIDEALPGVREQLQAAAQTGGDVTLPTASFAARVAGTDLGNAMLPHVRLAPDAMSVTEAQEFQKNRDQLVEQARVIMEEKGRADDAFVQEAQAIEDRIYQEVVATGTMDEKAARANATFVRDLYVTMAARMNTTPAALEQRFPYRVEAQGVAITEQLEQVSPEIISQLTDDEVRQLLDYAYEVDAIQSDIDALEIELDRREIEEDDPSGSDDELTRSNTGIGIEELMRQSAQHGRVNKLTPEQLGAFIRSDGDFSVIAQAEPLATVTDAELGQEAYNALEAHERRIRSMRARLTSNTRATANIMQQSPVTPGFYSALEREVAAIDAKALTASGWAERFKGLLAKGAIKADELEWSGLNDYLKMQEGKVSKDAVLEFLRGNGVRVERTTLMQRETGADPADIRTLNDAGLVISQDPYNFDDPTFFDNKSESFLDAADVQSLANQGKVSQDVADAALRVASLVQQSELPKYNRQPLVLPGGTNYREVLLTLPVKPSPELSGTIEALPNGKFRVDYPGTRSFVFDTREEAESDLGEMRLAMGEKPSGVFRSTHWDQPNVLVHLRMNDRVDADGKRVLFVEEVQSDWGQQGRKQRFAGGFIRAPFVDNTDGWLNLGLKQVLLEAVRGNYDRVAFVNGEQSAQRYDLSQQVDRIVVSPRAGLKRVNIELKTGNILSYGVDANGIISETTEESMRIAGAGTPLEKVIGKELSGKIMQTERGTFEGGDLKVGGEGMKAFYDKIVPIAMGNLLKKYGGVKLGSVMLPNMRQQEMEADADRMGMTIEDVLDVADESEYAQAQPGFDITPEMVKKLESGLPLFQAARGPARGGFDPSRLTTILNKNADLSTFIHETAHFYLTILGNLAADPAATPEIRADMDTLLKWFGIAGDTEAARLAAWNAMSVDQQRKYHEQFAYSFEVYMFEGKSPSAEMQGLFDRFSAWLKRVYRSIRDDLNAIYRREFGEDLPLLTGEVRQVMDRMLASEEQIKRQAAINEMKPMFQTQEQSGMDDAEWAAYQQMQQEAVKAAVTDMNKASLRQMQWLSNARARILRDLQAKHAKQRKEIREEVAEEIRRQPLYRAMEYLRTGTFTDADGESVKMEGAHRLDMESVRQMYELEPENLRPDIAKLGTGGRGMMGMNGIDPDVAAELFGFSSGDELIRALIEAQPMKEAIDARTDEVMLERFSELSTPEGREAKVQESLHNEARARFVAVELRFVAKATQPARVLVEAARQAAREMIAGKRIADLRPSEFIAAEARAARSAAKIGKPVNVDTVAKAAETRAMNIAREHGLAPDEVMAAGVEAGAIAQQAAQARLDEQRAQYGADPAQALIRAKRAQLYQNQLAAEALAARDEVEKGVRYLRQVMRDSNVKRMGADVADQIDRILERFNLRPMSAKRMAERQSLVQWLESLKESGLEPDLAPEILDEAARKPYREMTVAEFRDLVDAVKQLEYIGKNAQKIKRAQEMAEFKEVRDEIVASVRGNFTGKETKPRSPTTAMGKRIAKAKRFLYSHLKAAAIARIMDGGKDDGPVWNFLIRTANEAGDMETRMRAEATKRLTEILAPVFALGKMGGKGIYFETVGMSLNREARLVIALNMGNDGNRQRLLDGEGWTLEQVQPILESLTEAEWKAVQDVWDYMESFRPLVGAKERRLYGREPKWVTPVPFTVRTADGKEVRLSGGYYPIKYDPVATERAETADEAEKARTELRGAYTAATTRRSFTKARAAKVEDRPLLYTMTGVYSGINDVIHDLAWHEWLIQANRLMRDEKFDRAVRETYGAEFKSQLKGWIKDVAAGERGAEDAADLFASYIRRSVSAAGLGFNIVSAILQVTGFSQSIVRVGAKHIARGVAVTTASPVQTMKFVNEKSSFMKERARTQFRELNELRNMVGDESAAQRRLRLGTYFLMMRMQRMVDVPTWVGAYEKALEAGKDDATAVALADQAVIDSQGSGMLKDLAKIERGGALSKLFTVFYSYMNTVYNMAAVSTMTPRSKGRLAADYAMLFIVPVVLNYALKKALTPDVDDEEPDMEKIATDLIAEELSFLMGTMVGVREFQNAANAVVGKETAARGYEGPAGLRAIGEAGRFAVQAKQLEFDRAFRRSAINMLGIGLGLPSAQINRTIDGIEALAEGETENPFAVMTGVQR